jgi:hypothetical protein
MNEPLSHGDLSQRDRYISELHRLRTQDKQLATMNDSRYEGKLVRSLRDIDERIAARQSGWKPGS